MNKYILQQCKDEYTLRHGIIANPGKFEGEPIETPYFYCCALDGGGWVMEVDQEEKTEFGITANYVLVCESNDGFVSLEYYDNEEDAETAEYEDMVDEYDLFGEDESE